MKVYKDKQFLVFDFENGKNVKYDFAIKKAIGIKGQYVKDIKSQLSGISLDEMIECCSDKNYGEFLKYIKKKHMYPITNIGTMLSLVPGYSNLEQFFSAGITNFSTDRGSNFTYRIDEVPKSLLKIAQSKNIKLSNCFVDFYKKNINGYNLAFNLDYISLNDNDILRILSSDRWTYQYGHESYFNILINKFGYNAKSLMLYLDGLKTYEALDDINHTLYELFDYANMMSQISNKYDKYPRNFLTTHNIAVRNYNRLKKIFEENLFQKRIDKSLEYQYEDYVFIYPECTQDIKDEAVQQNNCVASYIDNVINGGCHILFLRKKDSPDKSLVTIEVRNNKIVQARRRFNDPVTEEDQRAINAWNKKFNKEKVA